MAHLFQFVRVPMRDGVSLAAKLFEFQEGPRPTLVLRTPYGLSVTTNPQTEYIPFLDAGYNLLWVSARGIDGSEGSFGSIDQETADGYDTIEWIIDQAWSDGRVGSYGMSYMGFTQWASASTGHPALRSAAITETALNWYRTFYSAGGALSAALTTHWHTLMGMLHEMQLLSTGAGDAGRVAALGSGLSDITALASQTPLAAHSLLKDDPRFQRVINHPEFDERWQAVDLSSSVPNMSAPVLAIAGWFDLFIADQLRDYERFSNDAESETARTQSRLIIGPWAHNPPLTTFAEVDFGPFAAAGADLTGEHLRHYERTIPVAGEVSTEALATPVRLFTMGINQWRDEASWPVPGTEYVELGLDANTGSLGEESIASSSIPYDYDPRNPVPTRGGNLQLIFDGYGPVEQKAIEERDDVLSFTTAPLENNVEATGYVSAVLYVSSTAVDTDFTARLIDVHPDGRALSVCDGIIRMRYRDGVDTTRLMTPGEVYRVEVELAPTSIVFLRGHRIRLDVSSSNFPRYDRNTNTGGRIAEESIDDAITATNTLHTGEGHRSHLRLPTVVR